MLILSHRYPFHYDKTEGVWNIVQCQYHAINAVLKDSVTGN